FLLLSLCLFLSFSFSSAFLLLLPPPLFTLFPYTTLFRSPLCLFLSLEHQLHFPIILSQPIQVFLLLHRLLFYLLKMSVILLFYPLNDLTSILTVFVIH